MFGVHAEAARRNERSLVAFLQGSSYPVAHGAGHQGCVWHEDDSVPTPILVWGYHVDGDAVRPESSVGLPEVF